MVRVCEDKYPKGFSYNRENGFYMEENLKSQLDILLKNITHDWDFTIIITGGGQVRVGKSLLAMQVASYWSYIMEKVYNKKTIFNLNTNFIFDGKRLIEIGNKLGKKAPFSCLIYDEAGADLEGRKVMTSMTQQVLDYYRECGQYNLLNILVMPEYFDLPKGLALSRSIFLLDVYCLSDEEGLFKRGYFNFYSRPNKKKLYLKGKKELNYKAYRYDFHGRFYNFYPVSEKEYRRLKQEALMKRESKRRNKFQLQRDACWYLFNREIGWAQAEIGKRMEQLTGIFVAQATINDGLSHFVSEKE